MMNELRLAQLLNQNISDERKFEILKDLDISYVIPNKSSAFPEKTAFLGYNCLHIAAIKSDLGLTRKLLNLGANVLQQGAQDGKTPLRKVMDYYENYSGRSIWELQGVLQEKPLANLLLSTQVNNDNSFNPKCKSGISHLHIACMLNHTEAVSILARSQESIDQIINVDSTVLPGYTPLHCAIRYSSSEAAIILLSRKADIYLENAEGMNSVCYLLEGLLEANDYLKMNRDSTHCYTHEREIERLGSILRAITLKYVTEDSKLLVSTGLSAFHLACALKDNWIMQSYLKTGNIENINKPATCKSKLWSGWTPLHFAACLNIETFGILLENKADAQIKNTNGDTAFDLCLQRHNFEKILEHVPYYMKNDKRHCSEPTKFTKLMSTLTGHSFYEFFKNLKDINMTIPLESPFCPGFNFLHVLILLHSCQKDPSVAHQKTDCKLKTDKYVYLPSTRCNCTWLHFEKILKAGCSVYYKNPGGLTPIHLAFKLQQWHMLDELLVRAQENIVGPDNVSFLHIACLMGKKEVIERLLKSGADVNSPITSSLEWCGKAKSFAEMSNGTKTLVRAKSTPLHIAVIFKMQEAVEELLKKNANVHAKDKLGLTPLHLSLLSSKSIAKLLFNGTSELKDKKRRDGLSYLHVAAFADDEKAVKKLLRDGADINCFVKNNVLNCFADFVNKTPLHLAVEDNEVARLLATKGANIVAHKRHLKAESPLDLALRNSSKTKFPFDKLIRDTTKIDALSASGITTLHIACATFNFAWARKLLERGANPNAQMIDGKGLANTPMHLLIEKAALEPSMPARLKLIVECLVNHGADVNISNNCETPLHAIFRLYFDEKVWPDLVDDNVAMNKILVPSIGNWLLLGLGSYVFNHTDTKGFSYFHFACLTGNLEVMKNYLDNGVDVNHSVSPFDEKYGGFTPLHFTVSLRNVAALRLLLEHGANARAEDKDGDTPLHYAVMRNFIDFRLFDALLRNGADINAKNLKNQTPIMCLLHRSDITYEQFYFFVSHGSLINITGTISDGQGIMGFTMGNTVESDIELVFKAMITFCDVDDAINNGFRAIHNVVSVEENENLTREHYLNAIRILMEKGSDIDEKDENGKRALDKAISFLNVGAIEALLLLGATVNVCEYQSDYSLTFSACWSCPLMRNQLWKMAWLKLDLNKTNRFTNETLKFNVNTLQLCQTELEKAGNTNICGSLTVKHFLSEWGAVIEYSAMSIAKRQTIDKFFGRTDDLLKEFPEFVGILLMQYRKALARVKLLPPVKGILVEAGIDLHDLCLETILQYFKNDELSLWIEEANEVLCPRQRRKMYY